jgi:hypothetical protein
VRVLAAIPAATLLVVIATAQPLAAQATRPVDSLALARQYTQWLYAGQVDSLLAHYPAGSRDSTARRAIQQDIDRLATRAGKEVQVIEEKFVRRNGRPQYWRTAQFSDLSDLILLRWVINSNGEITGFGLGLASQAPPIDPED